MCLVCNIRFINYDIDYHLRILLRHISDKGYHILILSTGQFFRCTGLTTDIITFYLCISTTTVLNNTVHITFQFINIDYSDKFEGAIEDKVIAEQKAQEAVNNTKRIKEEAEQKLISAKAEAEAMEIKSEALSKNKGLTEYEAVQRWDGRLPQYMLGNSVPFVNLGGK